MPSSIMHNISGAILFTPYTIKVYSECFIGYRARKVREITYSLIWNGIFIFITFSGDLHARDICLDERMLIYSLDDVQKEMSDGDR